MKRNSEEQGRRIRNKGREKDKLLRKLRKSRSPQKWMHEQCLAALAERERCIALEIQDGCMKAEVIARAGQAYDQNYKSSSA